VSGIHIRDVLDAIAARHPGLIEKFGGHAMAAGMTLPESSLDGFRRAFAEEIAARAERSDILNVVGVSSLTPASVRAVVSSRTGTPSLEK